MLFTFSNGLPITSKVLCSFQLIIDDISFSTLIVIAINYYNDAFVYANNDNDIILLK